MGNISVFFILFVIALIISAVGFYKFVYFISLGYGFSISAIGIALLLIYRDKLEIITFIACALFIVYGLRLGGYLLIREIKSSSYNRVMKTQIKDGSSMNIVLKIIVWLSCALLYVCEVSPVYFLIENAVKTNIVTYVGVIVMICGITLESTADLQKSKAKKINPHRFCDGGLYHIVRCPNYLGEVVFWSGVFVTGVTSLNGILQWVAATCGYICIVYIMFGGARRLEIRQNKNYGLDKDYQKYVKNTPILIPLVHLYSVAKYKWLVG